MLQANLAFRNIGPLRAVRAGMGERVRVGLIGAGYVASRHLTALKSLPFVDVAAICDLDLGRAAALAKQFAVSQVFQSLDEFFGAGLDVVHVLTPPASHREVTLCALRENCHVFVEKPMAETAEECDSMIAEASYRNLVLSVNHSLLFEPAVEKALELIDRGALGDILSLTYFRGSEYAPYSGGRPPAIYAQASYPFRDLGVHALYLIERIAGPIQKLTVDCSSTERDPMLQFDEWRVTAKTSTATANAVLSWNMQPLQNEFWVHGTRGILHVDLFLQLCQLQKTYPGPKQLGFVANGMRHACARSTAIPLFLLRAVTGRLKASPGIYHSVIAFHQALRDRRTFPVTAEQGRRVVSLITAAVSEADAARVRDDLARRQKTAPARILVTGASGLLGSELLRQLIECGERPRVLLRRPPSPGSPAFGLDCVIGNLGDPEIVDRAVEGVEVVYHVGAAMGGHPAAFEAGTVWGTRNVVNACRKYGVKRLIHVSSLGVLEVSGNPSGVAVTESSRVEPHPALRGTYTRTKHEAERIVLDAIREHGLRAVVIRPGQIFRPGTAAAAPSGVISLGGRWLVAGDGERHLPLVHVSDVARGLIAAASSPAALGQTIHLVDPTPVTQNEFIKCCGAAASPRVTRVPVPLLLFLAFICDLIGKLTGRNLPLSVYRVRSLRPLFPIDISAAISILGWEPKFRHDSAPLAAASRLENRDFLSREMEENEARLMTTGNRAYK